MASFGDALRLVRERATQFCNPVLVEFRHNIELRRLQRERQRSEDEYHALIVAEKDRDKQEQLSHEQFHDRDEFQDEIDRLQTRYLIVKAETYNLVVPSFSTTGPDWAESRTNPSGWFLTRAAQIELSTAIRAEKAARRQVALQWSQILIPVLSLVVAIIALVKK